MFEYYGWIKISEKPYFVEESQISEIVKEIKMYIDNTNWNNGLLDILPTNGEYHLLLTGFKNHNYVEPDILDLLNFIAEVSSGSYGLLYVRDDEDKNGNENKFRVFVLRRGNIEEHEDTFLSPFIPKVEDYEAD